MTKKYSSKVSYGLLTIVFVVFFSPLILNLVNDGITMNMILIGLFLILIFGLITHMFFKTEYTIEENTIEENTINIKCGFFRYKPIAIKDIKEISKSSNIISSPAASFDRIEIKYGKFEELIISPKNKFEFAEHLTKLNPKIKNNITEK
tara:strand:- start:1443 stop:1889 length:447 start_codon:yes stop_codon:yes gene_type:complete